ncbi:MAG: undecaprenyldiphospho-muramoylpentapeptide beta-N-acetylglucosaminyltransferase [Patescibacteria group bacterium]|nr:MAG: undecaprenyldiphospho-muramoylpentapeptide beta-N-acetylglucosaminyltransferase [Patescibacteria group bacterium]
MQELKEEIKEEKKDKEYGNQKKTIVLSGGGTGGSVAPLLALVEDLKLSGYNPVWFGTKDGVEKVMVEPYTLPYYSLPAGKFRRYWSFRNFTDIFKIKIAFFKSLSLLFKLKPTCLITAGAFVSVPTVWAAWCLRIPVVVHQQDIRPGLANRLMAPFAKTITVTFEKNLKDYGSKAIWLGNPVNKEFRIIKTITEAEKNIKQDSHHQVFNNTLPTILVLGGGTGSLAINDLVKTSLNDLLSFAKVVHVGGFLRNKEEEGEKERNEDKQDKEKINGQYVYHKFLDSRSLSLVMREADLVITRAGLSTLTELCSLKKLCIIIPMPNSHQEDNAAYFAKQGAALVLWQKDLNKETLLSLIKDILQDKNQQEEFKRNISKIMKEGANENMLEIIKKLSS